MNKILQNQIASFVSGQKELSAELMDLFYTVSQTYDYFENKLARYGADAVKVDKHGADERRLL